MGLLRGRCSSKSGGHALNPSLRSTQDLAITPSESNTRAQDHYSYESVTVFSIDDHNGLCDIKCGAHVGLHGGGEYYASAGNIHREVVHKQYARLLMEVAYFFRVVYCFSRLPLRNVQDGSTVARGLGEASQNVHEIWVMSVEIVFGLAIGGSVWVAESIGPSQKKRTLGVMVTSRISGFVFISGMRYFRDSCGWREQTLVMHCQPGMRLTRHQYSLLHKLLLGWSCRRREHPSRQTCRKRKCLS